VNDFLRWKELELDTLLPVNEEGDEVDTKSNDDEEEEGCVAAGVDDNESSRIDSQNLLSSDYYRGVQINLCARFFRYFFNCISVTSKHLVDVERLNLYSSSTVTSSPEKMLILR